MKDFAELILQLDQTNKTNEKIKHLAAYFAVASDQDKVWAIALFSHRRPKRPVNTTVLKTWAAEVANQPLWLIDECRTLVGDLAETISLVLPSPSQKGEKSLSEWLDVVIGLHKLSDAEKKQAVIQAWDSLNQAERFVFNKFFTGGWRLGVSQKTMINALAQVVDIEKAKIAHCLMGDWNPKKITFDELMQDAGTEVLPSKPYPFFLSYAVDVPEQEPLVADGFLAEWKWDGIRSQIIKREDALYIWSRGEELISKKFPELGSLLEVLPNGTVIDGEVLPYKEGQILPFGKLQTRLGRKNVTKKILEEAPVIVKAYDLLEYKHADIRQYPIEERKKLLLQVVAEAATENLQFSEVVPIASWEALDVLRKTSRDYAAEGFMLKKKGSPYLDGRKKGYWYKWKVEPFSIDAVLTYAMRGSGRRANLYTDYTFSVWNAARELITLTKAYSGLDDEEIRQVDNFVRRNTLNRFGPVREVKPQLVFELAFEALQPSSRHKSGIALRFPRVKRWRHDKKAEEANTLEDVQELLKAYQPSV